MALKSDHQRIEDLEKAATELASVTTSLYAALTRLGLFLVKDGTLHTAHYRAMINELDQVGVRLRSALDHLTEVKKDGE